MMFGFTLIKELFVSDINAARQIKADAEEDLKVGESLPFVLQKFIAASGFRTAQPVHAINIKWKDTMLRFSAGSSWKAISCSQVNFVKIPVRLVYMKLYIWKLLPIEAYDRFINGQGNMLVKILKFLNMVNARGPEMNEAELVTILAETMIFPLYALQNYISWTAIDAFTIKGTICYQGITVSGHFYFNEDFEIVRFETFDRYYSEKGKGYQKMKWTATAQKYIHDQGLKYPSYFTATWNTADGDFDYFKGSIERIFMVF